VARRVRSSVDVDKISICGLKLTGRVLILFSAVWVLSFISSLRRQGWTQLEGGVILFLVFLIPGIAAIRLSARRPLARSKLSGDDCSSKV
jgi:hypothetical protein